MQIHITPNITPINNKTPNKHKKVSRQDKSSSYPQKTPKENTQKKGNNTDDKQHHTIDTTV